MEKRNEMDKANAVFTVNTTVGNMVRFKDLAKATGITQKKLFNEAVDVLSRKYNAEAMADAR